MFSHGQRLDPIREYFDVLLADDDIVATSHVSTTYLGIAIPVRRHARGHGHRSSAAGAGDPGSRTASCAPGDAAAITAPPSSSALMMVRTLWLIDELEQPAVRLGAKRDGEGAGTDKVWLSQGYGMQAVEGATGLDLFLGLTPLTSCAMAIVVSGCSATGLQREPLGTQDRTAFVREPAVHL